MSFKEYYGWLGQFVSFKDHYGWPEPEYQNTDIHPISDGEDFGTYCKCLKLKPWCTYGLTLTDFGDMYFQ